MKVNPNPSNASLWIGIEIQTQSGSLLQPTFLSFWDQKSFESYNPEEPYLYNSDALLGLSSYLLYFNAHHKNPLHWFSEDKLHSLWSQMEPHFELFERAKERVHAFQENSRERTKQSLQSSSDSSIQHFLSGLGDVLRRNIRDDGFDLLGMTQIIELMDELEKDLKKPLLFNFDLSWSSSTMAVLHYLHSFLFNLRALVAIEYNNHITEPTFDAIKVDSITDYLGKADYIVNDALLIDSMIHLKTKMSPYIEISRSNEFWQDLHQIYKSYAYSGLLLLNNIPRQHLDPLSESSKEEFLYMAQMDWLLGTLGGTLFRIREELYGLQRNYVDVFWPELQIKSIQKSSPIQVNCFLKAG